MRVSEEKKVVLYIGGFQLPDKNAAALRVMSNAKALRDFGYDVIFVNALVEYDFSPRKTFYDGFETYEYKREAQREYLLSISRIQRIIEKTEAKIVIAYNYPAIALNRLRRYCKKHNVKCYADATEWYTPTGNIVFRIIKGIDTELRMRYVHPRMDGIIAVSEYLYNYYKRKVKTVKIPPLVDILETKWNILISDLHEGTRFIYAGSPSTQKERLDWIVDAVETFENGNIHLDVVGLTEDQFNQMYECSYEGSKVTFHGCVSNACVIKMIKESDWAIVLRENSKVVRAGFPTKIPEAITCGTPVIANKFSNIDNYLNENNSILFDNMEQLDKVLKLAINKKMKVDEKLFDYRNYEKDFAYMFNS